MVAVSDLKALRAMLRMEMMETSGLESSDSNLGSVVALTILEQVSDKKFKNLTELVQALNSL